MKDIFDIYGISDSERLYVLGNGFDLHHNIKSGYYDFRKWLQATNQGTLIDMMDIFFSNNRGFWSDIENALGEYREDAITEWCEPDNPDDYKYEHPTTWQAGVEDSISYIFGDVMDKFKESFHKWVDSIDISGIHHDLQLPKSAKYLTFNYTDTLESEYGIPPENIVHIHGNRMVPGDEYIIGHGNLRDSDEPFLDDGILFPYQNAYGEVISIMNGWNKDPQQIIMRHKYFFKSLNQCKGVCVLGFSYSSIDKPYLEEIIRKVDKNSLWIFNYFNDRDYAQAEKLAREFKITNFVIVHSDSHVMDYSEAYGISRRMALLQGVKEFQYDRKETLYYDETDNVKHLILLQNKQLNAREDTCFVLGGIQADDFVNDCELRAALGKTEARELKSTKDLKGDFSQIMRKDITSRSLDLILHKGWHIHFFMVQVWYYGFVDIVDSINPDANLSNALKATLYRILTFSQDDTVSLLSKYRYPNIKEKDKNDFLRGLISLTEKYLIQCTNKMHYIMAVQIRCLLECAKEKELTFIQDEPADEWVARFNQFYKSEIYSYPQRTLIFDKEMQVEKALKEEVIVVEGKVLSNYCFVDSELAPMIQFCDYVVAILKKFFVFIDRSYQEVTNDLNGYDTIQMNCFKKLIAALCLSVDYNPVFFHYIASVELVENLNQLLKEYGT